MAILISDKSYLSSGGTYGLNTSLFDSNLKFNSTSNSILYYTIADYTQTLVSGSTVYIKLISTGKLEGYLNNSLYNYRFNFDKYIKISQNNEQEIDRSIKASYILRTNKGNKDYSSLFFGLSNTNIIDINTTDKYIDENGEIYIKLTNSYDFISKYDFIFLDVSYGNITVDFSKLVPLTNNIYFYKNTWVSFSVPSPVTSDYVVGLYDVNNNKIVTNITGLTYPDDNSGVTYIQYNNYIFLYVPENCEYIKIELPNTNNIYKYYTKCPPKNLNCFYYYNLNGSLDVLYTEGTLNIIDLTSKKYLTSGNNKFVYSIETTKQLKVNTGYKLTENEIRSLMKSPYIFHNSNERLYDPNDSNPTYGYPVLNSYTLDNNTFDGYTGKKLSERNIELVLNEDKTYKRKSNFKLGFFD